MKSTRLLKPMGFEFTFEHKDYVRDNDQHNDGRNIYPILENQCELIKSVFHCNADIDDMCLEVNSPVFRTMEKAVRWYEHLKAYLGSDYMPAVANSTGGGTHIHIGTKGKRDTKFETAFGTIMFNRPFLTYAFQSPYDPDSSEPLAYREPRFSDNFNIESYRNYGDKDTAVNICTRIGTIELRIFDVIHSSEELRTYIQTANYLIGLAMKGPEPLRTFDQSKFFKTYLQTVALKEWKAFKKQAGIRFTDTRLLERREFEKPVKPKKVRSAITNRDRSNMQRALSKLRKLRSSRVVAFDTETTSIEPFKIVVNPTFVRNMRSAEPNIQVLPSGRRNGRVYRMSSLSESASIPPGEYQMRINEMPAHVLHRVLHRQFTELYSAPGHSIVEGKATRILRGVEAEMFMRNQNRRRDENVLEVVAEDVGNEYRLRVTYRVTNENREQFLGLRE